MHTSKEYRQKAWTAIKPVLPIMLLIFLAASLPQLICLFIQNACGLTPPMDTDLLVSDSNAFMTAYSDFMSSSKGMTYSLLNLLFSLIAVPLTLGTIGAAQRLLRGEEVLVRHSLAYISYTFRAIWLQICTGFYAAWPMLLTYVITVLLLITVPSPSVIMLVSFLFIIALIATAVLAVVRTYTMAAANFLMAKEPNRSVSDIMRTSRTIMSGNRMRFFLLTLSFIGWVLAVAAIDVVCIALTQSMLIGNVVGMLLTLALNCYMTTAQAAFINDLSENSAPQSDGGKMTE